jgi:hypothetical protein
MFIDIIKYSLPAVVVLVGIYLIVQILLKNELKKQSLEVLLNNRKTLLPIKLQAYERIVLLLERIAPQNMVLRTQKPGMTNQELQSALLKTIRQEYEHNLTQQIYVSNRSWQLVLSAKEHLVKIINQNAIRVKPDGPAIQLSKLILEHEIDKDRDTLQKAIDQVKAEVSTIFQ